MRCPRLLLDANLAPGRRVELPPDLLRHAVSVLRLRDGAPCQVFDGRGSEHHARLILSGRRGGAVEIGAVAAAPTTPELPLRLLQGIARGDHMDLAIQKAVELGVGEIWPVLSARSRSAAAHRGLERKGAHWHGVLRAAAEQCGRNELPRLDPPRDFAQALADLPREGLRVLADPEGVPAGVWRCQEADASAGPVTLLVGPEGGLTSEERAQGRHAGFRGLRLGPRILRTETAAIAALTTLQLLYGDLR
ncbi:Ribosomal RNA small subunit methyltransferase E [Thioalkalivibrio nitratireducens DSM 14787]|uniref:Ribosomal RNA small subunit methyltransferase E n=1 Tax=Thioalkalivibrio nitratireducens (strain DSM 14787 / UNIQEM 213 / ALEN2) TaxID=1255043 RepID=L0DR37_THIND|nr:16S rRNA (uracil(1498)-N(3))-methyltransferase [Thioalkalivibrio nitratireducens]AGA32044.1 Ribosomal RNA small subunit methyltransferase E [Thioalkalivibrio nitratireducens DSM 14787]